jgi:phosphatidylinositol kinase/protein kinase (PI-3  family)
MILTACKIFFPDLQNPSFCLLIINKRHQMLSFWSQVKGGEDLRQDERIQQALRTMNFVLRQDQKCRQKYLMINTYVVEPISMRTGLLQWVQDTTTFEGLIGKLETNFAEAPKDVKWFKEFIHSSEQSDGAKQSDRIAARWTNSALHGPLDI